MVDLLQYLPWFVLLVIYLGEKIQQWALTRSLNDALIRAQQATAPRVPVPAPPPPPIKLSPPPAAPPTPTPPPATGIFASYPDWFQTAAREIGFRETGTNQGISRYINLAHCGAEGDPWCAIFANACLESVGVPGTRSASSQSFRTNANFVQLQLPAPGCIVVYWRGSPTSGLGHVGFYRGEDATQIWTLGGNEDDMVQIEALPKSSAGLGLIGYWWPKSVPLPRSGAVMMPSGSPSQVTVAPDGTSAAVPAPAKPIATSVPNGIQNRITATMFSGDHSAYGPPINDKIPGAALPFHFADPRPRVRVTSVNTGASIDCDIVDVGPWNINDPYWQTGSRPEAETGTDLGQTGSRRKTNSAGIDLTLAAAQAIGVDGKGLVNWNFI